KIQTLASGYFEPGEHKAEISGLSSGVYLYALKAGEFYDTGKMVVK
ncbi:MAG: hypothetical protein GY771_08965, partial [bacterium]|nr:hypothetical protein [bacterium]